MLSPHTPRPVSGKSHLTNPFVIGLGITSIGALSLAISLAILDSWLAAALAFYFSQFSLALLLLIHCNRGLFFQDIRLLFVLIYTLYGLMLPGSTLAGYGYFHGMSPQDPSLIGATVLYASGLVAFNLVLWRFPIPWRNPSIGTNLSSHSTILGRVGLVALTAWLIAYPLSRGVQLTLSIDRLGRNLIYTQLWIVTIFFIDGAFMYFLWNYQALRAKSKVVVLICLAIYIAFMIFSLGARRDFLPLLLFAMAIVSTKRQTRLGMRHLATLALLFVIFLTIGVVRELPNHEPRGLAYELSLAFGNNEFSIPIQTVTHYIGTTEFTPRLGATYIYWPLLFIPRQLWDGKPNSLSVEFSHDTGITQGYAYTPVTEAFVNFGWIGPFVCIGALSIALSWLVAHARHMPFIYFVCFALVPDFNRGEFGLTLYQLIIIYGAARLFSLLTAASKLRFSGDRTRAQSRDSTRNRPASPAAPTVRPLQ